ncbi:MAG TPA: excinuclease ABC subunit UvrA [Candidatus Ratteibacteria bacterium]|nr:excinuclease ABC subunit UvrA [Candidatus Ratteibacteria bacterium]
MDQEVKISQVIPEDSSRYIIIQGAREHNLKNISLKIPRNSFIVITGISGSGKSSLAFDTLYAEGQRRYIESLSAYARQFLEQMKKPDVDHIFGLPPAIAIEQRKSASNPRSTVATTTEIYDYLRLLYARIGECHCPKCHRPITKQSSSEIIDRIVSLPNENSIIVLAPVVRGRKGEYRKILDEIKKSGFLRARIDGKIFDLDEDVSLKRYRTHSIEVVIDEIEPTSDRQRIAESIELGLKIGKGLIVIHQNGNDLLFSERLSCPACGISFEELAPRNFSFNSPYGACPECKGLGFLMKIDPDLVIPDRDKTFREGAIKPWQDTGGRHIFFYYRGLLRDMLRHIGRKLDDRIKDLSKKEIDFLLYGDDEGIYEGVIPNLERLFHQTESEFRREEIMKYMRELVCPSCHGDRLKPEALAVTVGDKSIMDVCRMSVSTVKNFFQHLQLTQRQQIIAQQILREIISRTDFLQEVGLDYLTLDRMTHTLSGGEAERIRLATQIGSGLVGVLYILDEPSIGLHPRDNKRLIATLRHLSSLGNTVIVIEHDEEMMRNADYIIDLGPGAGKNGGEIVGCGTIHDIIASEKSITGRYLSRKEFIVVPEKRRKPGDKHILIVGASHNNLKNIDVSIPLGLFVCVTGVSGSGKSSLIDDVLTQGLRKILYSSKVVPGKHKAILGVEHIDKVVIIDQSPIGRTPRSNPATYTGAFDLIRRMFSITQESRIRGYKPGRFSFNLKDGRCEACQGEGITKIEMHFLPDVFIQCEVCGGKRYNRETLEIKYHGKNIAEILEMKIEDASEFFKDNIAISAKLQTLCDVGLGYLELGQPATTLSGGEAQRVKLATELSRKGTEKTLYILDEPTTGLHLYDIQKLLGVLNRLVDKGSTVVVIEHNIEVIKSADYIIDLGPEGGDKGGEVVCTGSPEEISRNKKSYTGQFLSKVLCQKIENVV